MLLYTQGVDKIQRNTIISIFTLCSVFVKAILQEFDALFPIYTYDELLVIVTQYPGTLMSYHTVNIMNMLTLKAYAKAKICIFMFSTSKS